MRPLGRGAVLFGCLGLVACAAMPAARSSATRSTATHHCDARCRCPSPALPPQRPEAPTRSAPATPPTARRSWRAPSFDHYRSAIENYVPVVPQQAQRAPRDEPAFAQYLVAMHARLHPIFSDTFLNALDTLPPEHPMNAPDLRATLELVLESQTGRLIHRGVIETSGVTAFDVSAIAAVERAAPFGAPPSATLSSDGKFYVHWTFRRDGMACSALGAHPYRLAR
jgi:hypothetical protein